MSLSRALVILLCALAAAPGAQAQDSLEVARPDSTKVPRPAPAKAARADTLRAVPAAAADSAERGRPSPTGSMLKSLLIPGLGQITLGRKLTAAVFVAFEGAAVAMVLKSQRDLNAARDAVPADSALIADRTRKREDWLVLMALNHLLSGIEAYVSANLWDFPSGLEIRAAPGGVRAAATIPFRIP